MIPEPLDIIMI